MVGFPSAYLGDSSSQGSYAHTFYLLFRVCPLNSGFLVRWSGSHGSLTVVGTSKSLMQAQHSICAFRCSPIALATPNCFLWAPLFINLFPHSRSLLIHLLLDAPPIPPPLQWSQGTHRGLFFSPLGSSSSPVSPQPLVKDPLTLLPVPISPPASGSSWYASKHLSRQG